MSCEHRWKAEQVGKLPAANKAVLAIAFKSPTHFTHSTHLTPPHPLHSPHSLPHLLNLGWQTGLAQLIEHGLSFF